MNRAFNKRKAYVKAIIHNDKKMLQAFADEKAGKTIMISNQADEDAFLLGVYKAAMSADTTQADNLPAPFYVNDYTGNSALYHTVMPQVDLL